MTAKTRAELANAERDARLRLQGDLWDAVNRYVLSCHGDPSKHVYGNVERQKTVATIEGIVRLFEKAAESRGRMLEREECERDARRIHGREAHGSL